MANLLVIDSGVGGIVFLAAAKAQLPQENFIYYADTFYAPYGDKYPETVRRRLVDIIEYYKPYDIKAIILACNTATSSAASYLRFAYSIPIIGMEPAVKPACEQTKSKVLVLATALTVQGEKFQQLKERFPERDIIGIGCPGLMELVEKMAPQEEILAYLTEKLNPFMAEKELALVIGCTHYSYLKREMQQLLPQAQIFDGITGTIRHVKEVLNTFPAQKEQQTGRLLWQSSLPGDYRRIGLPFYEKAQKVL